MHCTVIMGGDVIDVVNQDILRGDLRIEDGIITALGRDLDCGSADMVIDAQGCYISPGFIDSHIHIESTMLPPLEFARTAVAHGTTTVLVDPHEITNVFGKKAIDFFLHQSDILPMDMFIGIPSCVPATSLENSGAAISLDDILSYLPDRRVYGLAEMMDYFDIIHGRGSARQKVQAVFDYGKIVDGHCPGLRGEELHAYISNGLRDGRVRIMSDHESTTYEEAAEKIRAGLHLAVRYGSAERDLDHILPGLIKNGDDLTRCMLCSDDLDPADLFRYGHVDRIIRRAAAIFEKNSSLSRREAILRALPMATCNPAGYLKSHYDRYNLPPAGTVSLGAQGSLVLLSDLEKLEVHSVVYKGHLILDRGCYLPRPISYDYSHLTESVNPGRNFAPGDFCIPCPDKAGTHRVHVIEIDHESLPTRDRIEPMEPRQLDHRAQLTANPERDIAEIAVIERHHARGSFSLGFASGLGLRRGAIASTITHDSHNLIVAGMDTESMSHAVNFLSRHGGGMVVIEDDKTVFFPLQIGGLMSVKPIREVVKDYEKVRRSARKLGAPTEDIFMVLSFLALPVIPEIRITDRGLVDVARMSLISLFD